MNSTLTDYGVPRRTWLMLSKWLYTAGTISGYELSQRIRAAHRQDLEPGWVWCERCQHFVRRFSKHTHPEPIT